MLPTLSELLEFLKLRFQTLEASHDHKHVQSPERHTNKYRALNVTNARNNFIICGQEHFIYKCKKFEEMTPSQRLAAIQKVKGCVNCLKLGHKSKTCKSGSCLKCQKKHNTMLHLEVNNHTQQSNIAQQSNSTAAISVLDSTTMSTLVSAQPVVQPKRALLTTMMVLITNNQGERIQCRAVLDNGSQINFITKTLLNKLGFRGRKCATDIEGIGRSAQKSTEKVNIEIASPVTGFNKHIEVYVLPRIIGNQPATNIDISNWNIPNNIKMADISFNEVGPVDILIGSGTFFSILTIGQICIGQNLPILQNSLFGWLVGGEYIDMEQTVCSITCGISLEDEKLDEQLERFWQLDDKGFTRNALTRNEHRIETFFQQNHRRAADGRYVVRLPFHGERSQLGQSSDIARQRFFGVERKLQRDMLLKTEYISFMREYEKLGHMTEVPLRDITGTHYFLPHHAVLKPESSTTKLRVVFDASAKTSTNISLNDLLSKGPTIQDDVFTILLRFRVPRFAFTADIEKMYRQIWVDEEDQQLQLIWWREDPTMPLKAYKLTTVTYGTTSAPYLAIKTLHSIADEQEKQFPLAAKAIRTNFYVDDVLGGSDKMVEACDIQNQLCTVLQSYGFKLRKWCANHPNLLKGIPKEDQEVELKFDEPVTPHTKTMGLKWNPSKDHFSIKIEEPSQQRITKRTILSDIARILIH